MRAYAGTLPLRTIFSRKARRDLAQTFYAQSEGEIVGMAIVSIVDEYPAAALRQPRAIVNSVFVVPSHRRFGLGHALVTQAVTWARLRGCAMVRLRSSRDGRALYASLGFVDGTEMELQL